MDPRSTHPDHAPVARLGGTGLLADDLWLMAHDDVTGRRFLQPRAMGLGLAGALLAELSAPRGALPYRPRSGRKLEEVFSDLMALPGSER